MRKLARKLARVLPGKRGVAPPAGGTPRQADRQDVGPFLARAGPDALVGDPTVAEGWERYARGHKGEAGKHLGDEWNSAEKLGVTVPAGEIPPYLDRQLFGPFLGEPEVILEIGAGGGRFTDVLMPRCRRLIATDTSPTMLEHLRRRFGHDGKLEVQLLDGRGLGATPDASVDAVFSYGVFVHLQHWDIFNYVRETARVLRPGGKAVIQHANTFSELGWQLFLRQVQPSLNRHKHPWSFSLMTPEIMREFAVRAGLVVERLDTAIVPRDCIALLRKP
jgi:SAM-dependent methyltransferase